MHKKVCFFILIFICSVTSAQTPYYRTKDSIKTHQLITDFYNLTEEQPEKAFKKIDTLNEITRRNHFKKSIYYYHFYSGYYYFVTHKFDSSFVNFKKAIVNAKKFLLKEGEINANNWIANLYYLEKKPKQAKKIYLSNIYLASKINFTEGVISSYFGLASLETDKEKSLKHLLTIDSICKTQNYKSAVLANTYQSISSIYLNSLNNRKKGIEYLQLFLQTSNDVNYYSGINFASTILGEIAFEDKNYPLASKYFNANLKRNQKSKLQIGIAHDFISLATVNIASKNYRKAKKELVNAIRILKELNSTITIDFASLSLTEVYIHLHEIKKAEIIILASKSLHLNSTNFRKQFFKTSILFYTTKKEYKNALVYQENLLKLEKSATESENLKEFLALENKYKATERKQQIQRLETTNKAVQLKNRHQKIFFISLLLMGFLILALILFAYRKKQQSAKNLKEKVQTLNALNPNKKKVNNADKRFLLQLENIIATKILDPTFSAETFAKLMHISRMQLHRKLKKITMLSTSEFIKTERLKVAEELLLTSNSSVSEVAYHCGFKDTSYFSKQFKSVYKKSPSSYRE